METWFLCLIEKQRFGRFLNRVARAEKLNIAGVRRQESEVTSRLRELNLFTLQSIRLARHELKIANLKYIIQTVIRSAFQ